MIAVEVARNAVQFNCNKCPRNHHCDESGEWPGSRGPAGYDVCEIPGVLASRTCLLPMVTPQAIAIRHLYRHYRNHVLPFAGGLYNQPNYYMQAMTVCDQLENQPSPQREKKR